MKMTDATGDLLACFTHGQFDLGKWEAYMDAFVPGAKALCLDDMREVVAAGYSWDEAFLPVLNAVCSDEKKREDAVRVFHHVTDRLEGTVVSRFGRTVDAELVLYLGLCSGAGWVTDVNGRTTVLLGIEKVMELGWCDENAMTALIVHELGHVYHLQYGAPWPECKSDREELLFQLFSEGVAMVFEQEVVGDPGYFHQDVDGWKDWCDRNFQRIKRSFEEDLGRMTAKDQRYFGDWVRFDGRGDTGYYLGARFVRFLMEKEPFDRVIDYGMEEIESGFRRFASDLHGGKRSL